MLKAFLRAIVGVFMPFVLIAAGAGLAALGLDRDWSILVWTGLILVGAGLIWGLFLILLADVGSPFE